MIVSYGKCVYYIRKLVLRNLYNVMMAIILLTLGFCVLVSIEKCKSVKIVFRSYSKDLLSKLQKVVILSNTTVLAGRNAQCSYYTCFNAYKCGKRGDHQILVYIYPIEHYVNEKREQIVHTRTREFHTILKTIRRSKFFTTNANDACLFVPSFDTLSYNNFRPRELNQALNALPYWRNGENHLLFNFLPPKQASVTNLATDKAFIAGAGFDSWTYRPTFDISLPAFVPLNNFSMIYPERTWLVTLSQLNIHRVHEGELKHLMSTSSGLVVLNRCTDADPSFRCYEKEQYKYPEVLQRSKFCIVFRGKRLAQPVLMEAMASGCIPVILSDGLIMPFEEVIDWKRASFFVLERNLHSVVEICKSVSESRRQEMSKQALWLYTKYFSSVEAITNATLDILNHRVFPKNTPFYEDWNVRPKFVAAHTPFLLREKSHSQSFTAIVLTYDRVDSLFLLIERLGSVASLSMILVVWNNRHKSPPELERWPKINKTVKLVRTSENKLSNRFLPYDEIETEAVLSLDDDISMLTDDELDFGFEVWQEFPDRIVGFPSRNHVWDNLTSSWRYESEWTNEISMILTGAAFYHKYWHYLYSTSMPAEIREWVDSRMNCEDIAMNFLVANTTNKAPIKVTPRKKFKCSKCTSTPMLSTDLNHMKERSKCINKFSEIYGHMPLKKVEFRADPVLYKDGFPSKLKRFKNIGIL